MRYKSEHRAHTGDNTVKDKPREPFGCVRRLQPAFNDLWDTGNPYAELGGIVGLAFVLYKGFCGRFDVLAANSFLADLKRFFVL